MLTDFPTSGRGFWCVMVCTLIPNFAFFFNSDFLTLHEVGKLISEFEGMWKETLAD
jgi:hypothetical protein